MRGRCGGKCCALAPSNFSRRLAKHSLLVSIRQAAPESDLQRRKLASQTSRKLLARPDAYFWSPPFQKWSQSPSQNAGDNHHRRSLEHSRLLISIAHRGIGPTKIRWFPTSDLLLDALGGAPESGGRLHPQVSCLRHAEQEATPFWCFQQMERTEFLPPSRKYSARFLTDALAKNLFACAPSVLPRGSSEAPSATLT